jgi:hypothetical protein
VAVSCRARAVIHAYRKPAVAKTQVNLAPKNEVEIPFPTPSDSLSNNGREVEWLERGFKIKRRRKREKHSGTTGNNATSAREVMEPVPLAKRRTRDASNDAQTPGFEQMKWETKSIQRQIKETPK